jgi:hypothetical protein
MMKNPVETIGNLIEKQGISFISSVDENAITLIGSHAWENEEWVPVELTDYGPFTSFGTIENGILRTGLYTNPGVRFSKQ